MCMQLNVEDPCIICHEDMSPEDVCVLECRHSFHDKVSGNITSSYYLNSVSKKYLMKNI